MGSNSSTDATGSLPLGTAVYEILREARDNDKRECREAVRYSFFRPVTISIAANSFTAFSREVSEVGIGLMHNMRLSPGEVEVSIPTDQGYSVRIRTDVLWCSPIGDGWFISGGKFISITGIRPHEPVL
jgi:hypothetical protein